MASALSPLCAASPGMASAAWRGREGAGTPPESTPERPPSGGKSPAALGGLAGARLPTIGGAAPGLGGPKSRDVLAALDDIAQGAGRARDAPHSGPATAWAGGGAGQHESTPKRSKEPSAAGADVVRQGVGLAVSKSLPSLTRQESGPQKGKGSSSGAADIRQGLGLPIQRRRLSLDPADLGPGLGAADPSGRQRRSSLGAQPSGLLADVPEMQVSERGANTPPPGSGSESLPAWATVSPPRAGSQSVNRSHTSKGLGHRSVSIPSHIVAKGAASAPVSRRTSLSGAASSKGVAKSLTRRSSNAGLPAPRAKAPKSYQEDEEAVQLAGEVFDFFDADGSGLLDRHELEVAQQILQSSSLDGAGVASGIWADCNPDTDGSGEVDSEEWATFMEAIYQILGRKQFISVTSAWLKDARSSQEREHEAARKIQNMVRRRSSAQNDEVALKVQNAALLALQQAAALKIQAMRRGNILRSSLSQQRRKSIQSNQLEHRLTTMSEVWELLTRVDGVYARTMTVGDFVDVFRHARETGLDTDLALTAPATDEGNVPGGTTVEDVLPVQVGRLCELVLDGDVDTLTDGEVWFDLAITKSDRLNNGLKDELLHRDLREREIGHKQFCRIIPILARTMSLDMQVVLSHMSWVKNRVFEAPAPLLALFVQQCASNKNRQRKEEAYRQRSPDVSILETPFSLIDHVKLCRNGQTGIHTSEMQYIFYTVSRHLPERLTARLETRKEANPHYMGKVPTIKRPKDAEQDTFVSEEAFQVLIEELWKVTPEGKFASPLAMLVYMIQQATENPLVSDENIAIELALAKRLKLKDGQKMGSTLPRFSGEPLSPAATMPRQIAGA